MAMLGANGGLIGVRRVSSSTAASGIWTANEQVLAKRADIWPFAGSYIFRYFRFANFANTSLDSNTIDFGEVELYDNDTKHTGITCTTSFSFDSGNASMLVDGITSTATRAYRQSWSTIRSDATISFDLGSAKTLTHVKIFSLYVQPRFPASFDLQGSTDGTSYTTLTTVTVGSFALVSGVTYSSAKILV